jgi:tellurite resistance protein TerC
LLCERDLCTLVALPCNASRPVWPRFVVKTKRGASLCPGLVLFAYRVKVSIDFINDMTRGSMDQTTVYETIGNTWMWVGFAMFVIVALAVDLVLLDKKKGQSVSPKEALVWSLVWVSLSLVFAALLWWHLNGQFDREFANLKTTEFLTGYLIEKSLSVDNIFVFLMIFTFFAVPPEFQRRALVIGVIAAIVLRVVMILIGAWLVAKFHWILYVFGAFLLLTGLKMLIFAESKPDLNQNPVLKLIRRHFNITDEFVGEKFSIKRDGVRFFTPLFVVIIMIGITDIVFVVDSIPAVFAIIGPVYCHDV